MTKKICLNLLVSIFLLFFFQFCAEEPTPSLYDPNFKASVSDPVISGIEPASGTFAGIGEITISGSNFSANMAQNHVYFNGVKGTILDGTTTQLKVLVPVVSGDSVQIQLRVDGALLFAEYYPYKLEIAVREYGGINYVSDAYGVACDLNENLYVSLGEGKIVKVTPDEEQEDYVTDAGGFYSALKMGPGGNLYGIRTRFLYQVPPGGGEINRATARLLKRPLDFDFDMNQNIYYIASEGLYLIRQDFSDTLAIEYPDVNLSGVRVFNDYVYVSGVNSGTTVPDMKIGIWRNQILTASGQLGPIEKVFDLEEYYNSTVGVPEIRTITFAQDGDLYIGVDSTSISEAITVVHPIAGGEYLPENAEPLYKVLIVPPASVFCWGNGQYLYMNRRSNINAEKSLLRITMGKNSAPYFGRQ